MNIFNLPRRFERKGWMLLAAGLAACQAAVPPARAADGIVYPETRRVDHVDSYHGVEVADPYRWLEEDVRQSDAVADWVAAQNRVTFDWLRDVPGRERIRRRLTELWNYEKYSAPFKAGGRYYFFKNDGLQNQSVLYRMASLEDEPEVLLDPNQWSADGTIALSGTAFSDDGRYLAYGVAEAGSDWRTWRVMDLATRQPISDEVKWVKFSGAEWTPDGRGFFYGRYREPEESAAFQNLNFDQKIFYHRIGTAQSDDVLVYERPDHPDWGFGLDVTEDGRYLVVTVWKGTDDKYQVHFRDLGETYSTMRVLIGHFENDYTFVGNDGTEFFFKTDFEAENGRVIAVDLRRPEPEFWREVIPESDQTLRTVNLVGNQFVAGYLMDAQTRVRVFSLDGRAIRDIPLPGPGTASGFGGRRTDTETFYSFSSFATPPSTYRFDMLTGESTRLNRAEVGFNPDDYEVRQVFYHSFDGTRVPMFLAHRRGMKLDGNQPTLLYGYGGFNIPLTPSFSVTRLAWMEMGGVFAMPNLRGGGEYGESWHRAGTKRRKQNVFDDFIRAAEWLIDHGYTRPDRLAIHGRSNGGLLVGAVMTQRPDLFGACLPGVGVMDMLRFQRFTAGRFWVDDYGSSDDPDDFRALLKYSPYHNILPGTRYPATMVTTADTDDRVVPGHSFKFAAALQHAQAADAPVLIRIETKAGHGAGKPTEKIIAEAADELAFLVRALGIRRDGSGR